MSATLDGNHAIGEDGPSLESPDERFDLLVTMLGQNVVIGRAERRLGAADQQDGRDRTTLGEGS